MPEEIEQPDDEQGPPADQEDVAPPAACPTPSDIFRARTEDL